MHPRARFDGAPRLSAPLAAIQPVTGGPPVDYVILSHRMAPIWTHFVGHANRSFPCTSEDPKSCIWDHLGSRSQFSGWLAVQRPFVRQLKFINLTESCVRDNPSLLDGNYDLRGRLLRVSRKGNSPRGRMLASLSEAPTDCRLLLKGGNMLNFLKSLYGFPHSWPVDPTRFKACDLNPETFWEDFCGDGGDM